MKSLKWGRILLAGIETQAAVLLIVMLVTMVYAFKLSYDVRGGPDEVLLGQFAESVSRSYWWILQTLLTVPATVWGLKKIESSLDLHGVLIGLVVAIVGLGLGFTLNFRAVVAFTMTVSAGRIGAALVAHRRMQ